MSDKALLDGYQTTWQVSTYQWRAWLIRDLFNSRPKLLLQLFRQMKIVTAEDLAKAISEEIK